MNATLRVLIVDDCEDDARLISWELRRAGFSLSTRRVEDAATMRVALESVQWDAVLCDSSMPTLDANRALALLAERHLDIPLILVSGGPGPSPASLDALARGARHFVSKDELWRLPPLLASEIGVAHAGKPPPDLGPARALSSAERVALLQERLLDQQHWVALGRMTASVVHDLNNILSVVRTCTWPIKNAVDAGTSVYGCAEEIEQAVQRASVLTHKLLELVQGRRTKSQTIHLGWVLEDLSKMLHRMVGPDIELVVTSPPSLPSVRADGGELEQVIVNLVTNAREAMPHGGQLSIAVSEVTDGVNATSPCALLAVSDTGTGIDPAIKERIFEPLFTTKAAHGGTGIGLSTVAEIVRRWGGTIRVDSEVGKGTTFGVYLPSAEASDAAGQPF